MTAIQSGCFQHDVTEDAVSPRMCVNCQELKNLNQFRATSCKCCSSCEDVMEATCTACGDKKTLTLFPLRPDSKFGRSCICRTCKRLGITAQVRTCSGAGCLALVPAYGNRKFCAPCREKAKLSWNINPMCPSLVNRRRKRKTAAWYLNEILKVDWLKINQGECM